MSEQSCREIGYYYHSLGGSYYYWHEKQPGMLEEVGGCQYYCRLYYCIDFQLKAVRTSSFYDKCLLCALQRKFDDDLSV